MSTAVAQKKVSAPPSGLFKPESEIAELVLGVGAKNWAAISVVWEREGLPRIDPMTGMRFWPAVESFLLRRHGMINSIVPTQADGAETW
jgi:hypothetical protein